MHFGELLKKERDKRNWTQKNVAKLLHDRAGEHILSDTTLSYIERGAQLPNIKVACNLIKLYNLNVIEIRNMFASENMPHIFESDTKDKTN